MSQLKYPLCFHPTTVVIVNGDKFLLDKLCSTVDSQHTIVKPFTDPSEALDYVNSMSFAPFNRRCTHALEEDVRNRHSMGVNLRLIQDEVYESNRFSQLTGVMCDYQMPGMNGFDFCEQVKNDYVSRMFLTKQRDARLITDAFNRGLIKKYVHIESETLAADLNSTLHEIQMKYFLHFSNLLFNTTITRGSECQTIFTEPGYIALLKNIIDDYNINEYYLMAVNGSYLLKNTKGGIFQLSIYDSQVEDASLLEGEHGTYYYNFTDIGKENLKKDPVFLEQFYKKHPKESVY